MDLGLKNKVAIVMGGTSGVGLKTAEMFLQEGARVAICGRDQQRMENACNIWSSLLLPSRFLRKPVT